MKIANYNLSFFLEHSSIEAKSEGKHSGNVAAVYGPEFTDGLGIKCRCGFGAICDDMPNGSVCDGDYAVVFLKKRCQRIDERTARKIHPALFEFLEKSI